jgi:hypothetical protein
VVDACVLGEIKMGRLAAYDATVRWPPGGRPAATLVATLGRLAELEAPAAAVVLRDSASNATNGRGSFMIVGFGEA